MSLLQIYQFYFPEGSDGGQCAAFAEKLYNFGPVGNSYAEKFHYWMTHGSGNLSDIQVGDILLEQVGQNGHVCIVNTDRGNYWQLTESNWHLDGIVHHTRLLNKNAPELVAHLRAPLKVTPINLEPMILVEQNGTYYVEGDKGYFGIAKVEFLQLLQRITDKVEHRQPQGSQLGVVDTETQTLFVIKDN